MRIEGRAYGQDFLVAEQGLDARSTHSDINSLPAGGLHLWIRYSGIAWAAFIRAATRASRPCAPSSPSLQLDIFPADNLAWFPLVPELRLRSDHRIYSGTWERALTEP